MTSPWTSFTTRSGLALEARQNLTRNSIGVGNVGQWDPGAWLCQVTTPSGTRRLVVDPELFACLFEPVPAEVVAAGGSP